jgi:hypothetical protein
VPAKRGWTPSVPTRGARLPSRPPGRGSASRHWRMRHSAAIPARHSMRSNKRTASPVVRRELGALREIQKAGRSRAHVINDDIGFLYSPMRRYSRRCSKNCGSPTSKKTTKMLPQSQRKYRSGAVPSREMLQQSTDSTWAHGASSGFTKICSLMFDEFIIYDSRVAAGLGGSSSLTQCCKSCRRFRQHWKTWSGSDLA